MESGPITTLKKIKNLKMSYSQLTQDMLLMVLKKGGQKNGSKTTG